MEREVASRRCANHWQREAAARCPECGRYFCRECITEHEDRILCADCLKSLTKGSEPKPVTAVILLRGFQTFVGVLILWVFFYYIGKALLLMPDEFHQGAIWQDQKK